MYYKMRKHKVKQSTKQHEKGTGFCKRKVSVYLDVNKVNPLTTNVPLI